MANDGVKGRVKGPLAVRVMSVCVALAALTGCHDSRCCSGFTSRGVGSADGTLFSQTGAASDEPVGVFDRRAVLIGYYKSEVFSTRLRSLKSQRDAALARGDRGLTSELESRGQAIQDVAHRQLAGEAPLTNIAEDLRADLPDLARDAGVSRIVARGCEREGATTVDLTSRIVERLRVAR